KEGKEYNQGVAYLDDGTMVVVDNARKMISKTIDIVVTSVLQTTAGKMIFGRYIEPGMAAQAQSSGQVSDRPRSASAPAPSVPASATPTPAAQQTESLRLRAAYPSLSLVADGLLSDPRHQPVHHRARHGVHRVEPLRPARSLRASLR